MLVQAAAMQSSAQKKFGLTRFAALYGFLEVFVLQLGMQICK
jgi:hypothetical protein